MPNEKPDTRAAAQHIMIYRVYKHIMQCRSDEIDKTGATVLSINGIHIRKKNDLCLNNDIKRYNCYCDQIKQS